MPQKPEEWAVVVAAIAMALLFLVSGGLVLRDTIRKRGRWGINVKGLTGITCPKCEEPLPAVRVPKNFRQTLWGGTTCEGCGCEVDKWGKEVGS
jgi:hypothetical protein